MVGCSPMITVEVPGQATETASFQVAVAVDYNGVTVDTETLTVTRTYPASPGSEFVTALNGSASYTVPSQPYGNYTAKVLIKHNGKVYAPGSVTTVESDQFSVAPDLPPGCFTFDTAATLSGWSSVGVSDTCDATILFRQASFPRPATQSLSLGAGGSLSLSVLPGSECGLDLNEAWRVIARSPDLQTASEWQGITGVAFRVASVTTPNVLQARPIVTYQGANGTPVMVTTENSAGVIVAEQLQGTDWNDFRIALTCC